MRPEPTSPAPAPRLFLITPMLGADDLGFSEKIEQALGAGDVACLLLRCEPRALETLTRRFAPLAQIRDVALLVEGDAQIALRAGADGAHVSCAGGTVEATLTQAARTLKPDHILGAGGLATRDAAMIAGEGDVDYLMFGDAQTPEPFDALLERVAWWADVFTVPCVAQARDVAQVAALAQAGADFVALGEACWREPAQAIAAAERALQAGTAA